MTGGGFTGFRAEALAFLRDLAANNDRVWFMPRKAVYEAEVKAPLQALVVDLARATAAAGLPLTGEPERSIFRLYRDTRFGRDKRPYKTNAGAALTRTGRRDGQGVLYVHVEPDRSFLGCGFWQPPAQLLAAFRARMVDGPAEFLAIAEAIGARGHKLSGGDELRRLPHGFESAAQSTIAPYLRWKSVIASCPLNDATVLSGHLVERAVTFAVDCRGLLDYGWELEDRGGWP
jgi:uncharacterized protein (TIGR02453 family)